jgi:hypothetical protein
MLLSEGDIDVRRCAVCFVVSGGNVKLSQAVGSVIFAAGDVTLESAGRVVIFAGGTVTLSHRAVKALVVTPRKLAAAKPFGEVCGASLILDGKPTPAPDLFTFRDLWVDYGLEVSLAHGRFVRIARIHENSVFGSVLQVGDLIVSRNEKKIESSGQFRRLLGHSLDIGSFDFEIERAGKTISVRADLKKKQ